MDTRALIREWPLTLIWIYTVYFYSSIYIFNMKISEKPDESAVGDLTIAFTLLARALHNVLLPVSLSHANPVMPW